MEREKQERKKNVRRMETIDDGTVVSIKEITIEREKEAIEALKEG